MHTNFYTIYIEVHNLLGQNAQIKQSSFSVKHTWNDNIFNKAAID